MGHRLLEEEVKKRIDKGWAISGAFLKLANFEILIEGNGSSYILYGNKNELFLFKKSEKYLLPCRVLGDNSNIDPEIIKYIHKSSGFKFNWI